MERLDSIEKQKWNQKYTQFNVDKFILGNLEISAENNFGNFDLQQISFSNEAVYFLTGKQKIGISFYNLKNNIEISLNEYLQDEEEIQEIKASNQNYCSILAMTTSFDKILFFQTNKQSSENQLVKIPFDYTIPEEQNLGYFYWKKNYFIFSLEKSIFEIQFTNFNENISMEEVLQVQDKFIKLHKKIDQAEEIGFWDCSQVTDLFYCKIDEKIKIINGANNLIYEIELEEKNESILNLKGFRQFLQIKPLTSENFSDYNYTLKDLLIFQTAKNKFQVLDVGKMKSKDKQKIKISNFDLFKKLNLPRYSKYDNFQISEDNRYFIMVNKEFKHLVILKISEIFSEGKNHEKDFQNVYPFFEKVACLPFSDKISQLSFKIERSDQVIGQFFNKQNKDLKDILVILYKIENQYSYSVVPLEPIFKLQNDLEENNISKIELDELSGIENDKEKSAQKNNDIILEDLKPTNEIKLVAEPNQKIDKKIQGQQKFVKENQSLNKNSNQSNKEKKLIIRNPTDDLNNTNQKKAKIERKLKQHKSNSIKMQEIKDGNSRISGTRNKEEFDDLFDNLQLKEKNPKSQLDQQIEKEIQKIVRIFENKLRSDIDSQLQNLKLKFNKDFGLQYHRFLEDFSERYQNLFQENNEQVLFPLIESTFKSVFEKYTKDLNEVYLNYQKKIETTFQMQSNLKHNLENIFSNREKNTKKLQKCLENYQKNFEKINNKKIADEFLITTLKKNLEEVQQNQVLIVQQAEEIITYVHELENKLSCDQIRPKEFSFQQKMSEKGSFTEITPQVQLIKQNQNLTLYKDPQTGKLFYANQIKQINLFILFCFQNSFYYLINFHRFLFYQLKIVVVNLEDLNLVIYFYFVNQGKMIILKLLLIMFSRTVLSFQISNQLIIEKVMIIHCSNKLIILQIYFSIKRLFHIDFFINSNLFTLSNLINFNLKLAYFDFLVKDLNS